PDVPAGDVALPAPVTELIFLRMDAGYARDWHPAPRRQFVFVSKGEVELRVSDGEVRRFGTGSVVLAEDTTGKGHQTRAAGAGDCVVVWVACP
ncbi:MAG: cupin domain-containing protein, partial [Actinomycetota bacterium]